MNNILSHKNFILLKESKIFKDVKEDEYTNNLLESYLNDEISFDEFEINFLKVNENLLTDIKSKIFTILNKVISNLKTIGTKIIGLLKTAYTLISKLMKKHPKLFKVLVILIIIMLLSTSAALASTNNPNESTMVLEAAVGYIKGMPQDDFTYQEIMDAQGALLAVKQNIVSSLDDEKLRDLFSDKSVSMAKIAKNMILDMSDKGKDGQVFQLWKVGKDLVLDYFRSGGMKSIIIK